MSDGAFVHYYFLPSLRRGLAAAIKVANADELVANGSKKRVRFDAEMKVTSDKSLPSDGVIPDQPIEIELYGPGDILGFDPRIVVRTDPLNYVGDFEPNYFPAVEFAEPDFPWRFTAKAAGQKGNLIPWISLIVLVAEDTPDGSKKKEILREGISNVTRVPWIEVNALNLPNLAQAWRWAHVQITAKQGLDEEEELRVELKEILSSSPERAIARLICARRLRPGMKYRAFIVPTFRLGRDRALGGSSGEAVTALTPAWTVGNWPFQLPYYYTWEFRTGMRGDFEHLVRLLEPRPLEQLGKREIDCSDPGFGLKDKINRDDPQANDTNRHRLELESALRSRDTQFTKWGMDSASRASGAEFRTMLATKLNQAQEYLEKPLIASDDPNDDPIVFAPMYGQWHRGKNTLSGSPDWFVELNLDPRHRAAAGFGAEVVRKNQEQLMAAAWDQVGAIEEANELLRLAQAGREASQRIQNRLDRLSASNYLWASSALHASVKAKQLEKTVRAQIEESPIGKAPFDSALRRIARQRGPLRKRQAFDTRIPKEDMILRLNEGKLQIASVQAPSPGMPGIGKITEQVNAAVSPAVIGTPPIGEHSGDFDYPFNVSAGQSGVQTEVKVGDRHGWLNLIDEGSGRYRLRGTPPNPLIAKNRIRSLTKPYPIALLIKQGGRVFTQQFTILVRAKRELRVMQPSGAGIARSYGRLFVKLLDWVQDWVKRLRVGNAHSYERLSTADLPARTAWQVVEQETTTISGRPVSEQFMEKNITKKAILAKIPQRDLNRTWAETAAETFDGWLAPATSEIIRKEKIADIARLCEHIKTNLSPATTIVKRIQQRVRIPSEKPRKPEQALNTIMAAPEFPQPVCRLLQEISQDFLLRGIEQVPQNTIAVLKMNNRFIEAVMCGANHAFSQELLWREFPSDLRGSYFRQFWDVTGIILDKPKIEEFTACYRKEKDVEPWSPEIRNRFVELYRFEDEDINDATLFDRIITRKAVEEGLKDISPLHRWLADRLGANSPGSGMEGRVVLIIRGDLLKKYPRSVIYAANSIDAVAGEEGLKYPIFSANAGVDIAFLGFNLSEDELRNRWFFVIEERVSEARFGLDEPPGKPLISEDDFAWDHFGLFVLSSESFDKLKSDGVPEAILTKLQSVKDKRFSKEDEFLQEVRRLIGQEQTDRYKSVIFERARVILERAQMIDYYLNDADPISGTLASQWSFNSASIAEYSAQRPVRIVISAKQMLPAARQ